MPDGGETSQAKTIGNAITRMHREHYGRGASITRTVISRNGEHVIVFLQDIYTTVERTLIANGDQETVKQTRQAFQMAMGPAFAQAVQEAMGRKVIQFMSQLSFDPDIAAEIFVLEPTTG